MKPEANRHRVPQTPAVRREMLRLVHHAQQNGQAILWFLATTAACCAVLALVYNVGQVANEKEKTINAADAAALSGAMVEARVLNFEAYTNRAMIANEVTIAQLVSTDSWLRYDNEMMFWIAQYTKLVPYLDEVTQAMSQATQTATTYFENLVYKPFVTWANGTIVILEAAREVSNGVAVFAADDVAGKIAHANQTTFGNRFDTQPELNGAFDVVFLLKNAADWLNFTRPYAGNERDKAKAVILASLDQFSTRRGAGPFIDTANRLLKWAGLAATWGMAYTGFDKTSGTTTLTNFDHWAAQDSLDPFVATRKWCKKWGFIPYPCGWNRHYVPVPIAYGRADVEPTMNTANDLCDVSPDTFNCTLARDDANVFRPPGWQGVPIIRDLRHPGGRDTPDPMLTYATAVQKSAQATLTTQRIGSRGMDTVDSGSNQPQGMPKLQDDLQNGDRLSSISLARVFFARPDWNARDRTQGDLPRSDHVHEYASLYNPYWQARLTTVDNGTKATFYWIIGHLELSPLTP